MQPSNPGRGSRRQPRVALAGHPGWARTANTEPCRGSINRRQQGPSATGTGLVREEKILLSKLIDVVNDRFGTDFTDVDQLFFDQIVEDASTDDSMRVAVNANPPEKFALLFGGHVENLLIERMDRNGEEIVGKYMTDPTFQSVVNEWLAAEVYKRLRKNQPGAQSRKPYRKPVQR